MANGGLPDDVVRFIGDHINSVEQLEVLLLLRATRPKAWDADAVAKELRIAPISAGERLEDLSVRGLAAASEEPAAGYRYSPRTGELDRAVGRLASVYAERRVSVITQIFSKPEDATPTPGDNIRLFSDAFKFRKKD